MQKEKKKTNKIVKFKHLTLKEFVHRAYKNVVVKFINNSDNNLTLIFKKTHKKKTTRTYFLAIEICLNK